MSKNDKNKKTAGAQGKKKVSLREYFKGVRKEMSRVIWPTKKELASYTLVVIGTCAVFALGFWLVDTGVLAALRRVLGVTMN